MSKQSLRVLFAPIDAVGHVNAAIGIAQVLLNAGHEVMFVINVQWKGRLEPYGIQEVLIAQDERSADVDPAKHWADLFISDGLKQWTPLEKLVNIRTKLGPSFVKKNIDLDKALDDILPNIKPDVIILDQVMCLPSVVLSDIPWILTCSFNPLSFLNDDRTPPGGSGLPAYESKNDWKAFRKVVSESQTNMIDKANEFLVARGVKSMDTNMAAYLSPYLNIYGFPLELDYLDMRPLPQNWLRFDNFKRYEKISKFEIPVELRDKPGKLIYFSLGSMGGADVQLMKRLTSILAKSKHRFIVAKGPNHTEYDLPDNMWGQQSVPQINVLPIVDLVITHGGNNTITETFYFGKPMIVMPLFGDQYDNAQRVHELGYGKRLDTYNCTEWELLSAIDTIVSDNSLTEKLKQIAKRIQSDNSLAKLPQIIENLVNNNNNN
ncbi:NDP-glycosyltransferase YjiC-like [Oppia nitens]|uniref:NDP-glycosyltransferase YjiC-like n=1 Tax=Oppia nitens TaxID=1686743 RepID=UPI0023DA5823|nr:NDP-glycosyltransferase YjiC-like [Oppia nitens]